jgi:hypothetical protein
MTDASNLNAESYNARQLNRSPGDVGSVHPPNPRRVSGRDEVEGERWDRDRPRGMKVSPTKIRARYYSHSQQQPASSSTSTISPPYNVHHQYHSNQPTTPQRSPTRTLHSPSNRRTYRTSPSSPTISSRSSSSSSITHHEPSQPSLGERYISHYPLSSQERSSYLFDKFDDSEREDGVGDAEGVILGNPIEVGKENERERGSSTPSPSLYTQGNKIMSGGPHLHAHPHVNVNGNGNLTYSTTPSKRGEEKDQAYMRFVPGLGLRSGAMTFDQDDSEDEEETDRAPVITFSSKGKNGRGEEGVGALNLNVIGNGKRLGEKRGRSRSLGDLRGLRKDKSGSRASGERSKEREEPMGDEITPGSHLPHFSLDTKFSLPPPSPLTHHPAHTTEKTTRGGLKKGETSEEDEEAVHFDLGLGKDLDHTIELAVKRAKAESTNMLGKKSLTRGNSRNDGLTKKSLVPDDTEVSTGKDEMSLIKTGMKEEMMKTQEVPLPAEAARVLNEARLAQQRELLLAGLRAMPKNGRKASMGMGLFKESAGKGGAEEAVGREGREKERVERERAETIPAALSRSTTRSRLVSAPVSEEEGEDDDNPEEDEGLEVKLKKGSKSVHHRARTVPAAPIEVVHPKERPIGPRTPLRSRASSPGPRDRTISIPPPKSINGTASRHVSPSVSRVTSRTTKASLPPVTLDEAAKHARDFSHGWTSEDTWESSSGLSSTGSETEGDEDDEEDGISDVSDYYQRDPRLLGSELRNNSTRSSHSPAFLHRRTPATIRRDHFENDQMSHKILPEHDRTGMESPEGQYRVDGPEIRDDGMMDTSQTSPVNRMTVPLQPFKNKVGGHSEIYKFTRRAVCKVRIEMWSRRFFIL